MIVNLSAPPLGKIETIDDIITAMTNEIKNKKMKPGKIVMGMGYDQSLLKSGRIPTRDDLDKISTEHGVFITHQSGHVGVANSFILDKLGIDEETVDPEGGVFVRYEGTKKPNGILEERAMMDLQMGFFPKPKLTQLKKIVKNGELYYTKNGITTCQDGGVAPMIYKAFKLVSLLKWLKIDVIGYYFANDVSDVEDYLAFKEPNKYRGHFRLAGMKILLDGSPQAKTAWLSKPYHIIPEGQSEDYRGYPTFEDEEKLQKMYSMIVKNNLQVLTHTNGDEASEQLIRCYENAEKITPHKESLRPVMIHAQTVREDQLDKMAKLEMIPSFFELHTYFWGDWHIDSVLGEERGHNISPTASALKRKMVYTVHCDTPVLPPDTAFMLWSAVNRLTRSGRTIGAHHKLSVMEAIKAQTIYGAYQYFEEDIKGSITVGKNSDLVIIDKDPLTMDPLKLRELKVLETIKNGKTIYKA
jgi:predicted amidohydrolase YtcJ